jgi:SAM-dependent methyltransferase
MEQHYGRAYDATISAGGARPEHWNWRRSQLLRWKSGGAVLDLGCSTGGFLSSLQDPSWRLFGIEMSAEVAVRARQQSGAEVFVGDILDAPFAPCSFDAITCFHVFEHLYQPREVLKKVHEWLRPGGVFYAMMPNIDSAGRRLFGSFWYALELPRHLYHFSPRPLRRLANSVGFEELSISTHRELFAEPSVRYLIDAGLSMLGLEPTPMSASLRDGLLGRAKHKIFRVTIGRALNHVASIVGDGEALHATFVKR